MDFLGATLKAVETAFALTTQFQTEVTFQLQIVWNLDPVKDTATEVPSYTKTVLAVVYKPDQRKIEPGYYVMTEKLCLPQWTDVPAPSINDRVIIGPFLRQVMSVSDDPANAIWTIETRLPTKQ